MTVLVDQGARAAVAADVARRYGCVCDVAVVQIIAAHISGRPDPVWNGRRLVQPGFKEQARRDGADAWARWRGGPLAVARRAALPGLLRAGLTDIEIANHLDVPVSTIVYDRGRLGLAANHGLTAARRAKAALIAGLDHRALTAAQVAALTGISPRSVRNICRDYRMALRRDPAVQDAALVLGNAVRSAGRAARHARILQLVTDGVNPADMPGILGAKVNSIRDDFTKLGLAFVDLTNPVSVRASAARRRSVTQVAA